MFSPHEARGDLSTAAWMEGVEGRAGPACRARSEGSGGNGFGPRRSCSGSQAMECIAQGGGGTIPGGVKEKEASGCGVG